MTRANGTGSVTARVTAGPDPRDSVALKRVVIFMIVNAAVGLVIATLIWAEHSRILDFQLAALAPADRSGARSQLSNQLWSRPGPSVAIALLYPLFIRQLRRGRYGAYRRLLVASVLQLVSLAWFVIGGTYPVWIEGLQLVQAAVAVTVIVQARRPAVRALFGRPARLTGGNARAAWLLVIAAPVIAELALGSTPPKLAYLVIAWVPIYGAGVLLIRELVVRTGHGWPSLVLLAGAYELLEDGFGLQALTSPHLYNAAHWGVRIFGLNLTYWQANLTYHVFFSVLIPITVVGLIFPGHRGRPYVANRPYLVLIAVAFAAGVVLLRLLVPPSQDPGYQTPLPYLVAFGIGIVVLAIVAFRFAPKRDEGLMVSSRLTRVPSSPAICLGVGLATLVVFAGTFRMLGSAQPAFTHGSWVLIPMGVALIVVIATAVAMVRYSRSPGWDDRRTLAVVGGALVAHSIAGILMMKPDTFNYAGMAVIIVATVALLLAGDRLLRRRARAIEAGV